MASRGRGSPGRGGHEGAEDVTPEQAARDQGRVGRFMAWLGFGPEEEPSGRPPAEEIGESLEEAEPRATEEITALEADLEQAKEEAARLRAELEDALERAAGAERRATEIETESRGEMERLREELALAQQHQEPAPVDELAEPKAPEAVEEPIEPEPLVELEEPEPLPGMVSLSNASLEDLRSLGMSVTQAKRVIDYRERIGGFDSIDDLDHVPGFPKALLAQIKEGVTL